MQEFSILKGCRVKIKPPRAPIIKEVFWSPPLHSWIKVNIDGAAISGKASVGGLFRNAEGNCLGCFAQLLGPVSALHAELTAAMTAIEIAAEKGCQNLWLETDSKLVSLAFHTISIVPWMLRTRWLNCLGIIRNMNFLVTHIFREGNSCANGLANIGLSLSTFDLFWFPSIPVSLSKEYIRNRL